MEILNEYYNIIKGGSQITIKSYGNNDNIILKKKKVLIQ